MLAEGVRFELTVGMTPSLVFKTSSINRSDNPPYLGRCSIPLEKPIEFPYRRKHYNPKNRLPQRLFALEIPKHSQDFKTGSQTARTPLPVG